MSSFFSSHKYSKIPSSIESGNEYDDDVKMSYQYQPSVFTAMTRGARSDSSGSYSSVASSDSAYEKVAPRAEDLAFYETLDGKYDTTDSKTNDRKVRFALDKELPALPSQASNRKMRRMSSRDGAYAWFAQRRYQTEEERLEDSMEKRTF